MRFGVLFAVCACVHAYAYTCMHATSKLCMLQYLNVYGLKIWESLEIYISSISKYKKSDIIPKNNLNCMGWAAAPCRPPRVLPFLNKKSDMKPVAAK